MKFFTREMISGELPETEFNATCKAYQQHIEQMLISSPKAIAELAEISLHDGLIRRVVLDHGANELLLALRCGDLQIGYFDLDIRYSGVALAPQQLKLISRRANDRSTEILADEFDMETDGRFVHRLLCWPEDELEIVFTGVTFEKQCQPCREFAYDEEPFIEVG